MKIEEGILIPGKWYKGMGKNYMKYSHIQEVDGYNRIHGIEFLRLGRYSKGNNYWANSNHEKEILKGAIDISEIAKYLPKDHPDLITGLTYEIY